jgi:hypothetical protein
MTGTMDSTLVSLIRRYILGTNATNVTGTRHARIAVRITLEQLV